jgi:hypothetical protein
MRRNLYAIKRNTPENKNTRKKNTNMSNISTALAIQEACSEVVFSDETMIFAAQIAQKSDYDPEVMMLLQKYAATLTAGVATKVIEVVMPISDFNHMMDELREVGALEEIEGEM